MTSYLLRMCDPPVSHLSSSMLTVPRPQNPRAQLRCACAQDIHAGPQRMDCAIDDDCAPRKRDDQPCHLRPQPHLSRCRAGVSELAQRASSERLAKRYALSLLFFSPIRNRWFVQDSNTPEPAFKQPFGVVSEADQMHSRLSIPPFNSRGDPAPLQSAKPGPRLLVLKTDRTIRPPTGLVQAPGAPPSHLSRMRSNPISPVTTSQQRYRKPGQWGATHRVSHRRDPDA
jgi:hypothetical protein